jgi:hypothetical protein
MEKPYTKVEDIGKPLVPKQAPPYRRKDKGEEGILSWINQQKHAYLIKIMIVVMIVLSFLGGMLWAFSYVMDGFNKGGVKESDSRLAGLLYGLVAKTAITPLVPAI